MLSAQLHLQDACRCGQTARCVPLAVFRGREAESSLPQGVSLQAFDPTFEEACCGSARLNELRCRVGMHTAAAAAGVPQASALSPFRVGVCDHGVLTPHQGALPAPLACTFEQVVRCVVALEDIAPRLDAANVLMEEELNAGLENAETIGEGGFGQV